MKILIADDHDMLADSLRVLLEAHGHDVIATVGTGHEAVSAAAHHRPDLALMEVAMPEMNGIEATRQITQRSPSTTVVMVSGREDRETLDAALDAGATGFLVKNLQPARLLPLIEAAVRGERVVSTQFETPQPTNGFSKLTSAVLDSGADQLTPREREVFQLISRGVSSNRALATTLGLSENTIKFHVRNILGKLHLKSRAEIPSYATGNRAAATL